jgi:hypothetical protein
MKDALHGEITYFYIERQQKFRYNNSLDWITHYISRCTEMEFNVWFDCGWLNKATKHTMCPSILTDLLLLLTSPNSEFVFRHIWLSFTWTNSTHLLLRSSINEFVLDIFDWVLPEWRAHICCWGLPLMSLFWTYWTPFQPSRPLLMCGNSGRLWVTNITPSQLCI